MKKTLNVSSKVHTFIVALILVAGTALGTAAWGHSTPLPHGQNHLKIKIVNVASVPPSNSAPAAPPPSQQPPTTPPSTPSSGTGGANSGTKPPVNRPPSEQQRHLHHHHCGCGNVPATPPPGYPGATPPAKSKIHHHHGPHHAKAPRHAVKTPRKGTSSAPPASAAPTPSAPASMPRCSLNDLSVFITQQGPTQEAVTSYTVYLDNTSRATCWMYGYPGAAFVNSRGQQIGITALDHPGEPPHGLVYLQPNPHAYPNAPSQWSTHFYVSVGVAAGGNWPGCMPVSVSLIQISLPGDLAVTKTLPFATQMPSDYRMTCSVPVQNLGPPGALIVPLAVSAVGYPQ
jgi:hypothetical protein